MYNPTKTQEQIDKEKECKILVRIYALLAVGLISEVNLIHDFTDYPTTKLAIKYCFTEITTDDMDLLDNILSHLEKRHEDTIRR